MSKVIVDLLETVVKLFEHRLFELFERTLGIGQRLFHVLALRLHIVVMLQQILVVLFRILVDGTERRDLVF